MAFLSPRSRGPLLIFALLLAVGVYLAQRPAPIRAAAATPGGPSATGMAQPESRPVAAERKGLSAASGRALFAFITAPANAAAIEAGLSAPTRSIHYVKLNDALIAGKRSPFWRTGGQGRIDVPLPDGRVLPVVIDRSDLSDVKRFTSLGHLDGQPGSRAIFAYNDGVLQAMIEDANLNRYTLRHAADGSTQFFQVDPALLPPCGGNLRPVADGDALTALAQAPKPAALPRVQGATAGPVAPVTPLTAAMAGAAGVQVHVLMAYTSAARQSAGGTAAADALMDLAIATMNSDLSRSQCAARVKLVGTAEVTYANDQLSSGSPNWLQNALEALRKTSDGKMDEIHALRDQLGADLVCLALNRPDSTSTIGIAYILDKPNDRLNPLFAFATVQLSSVGASHVVSHELGHNLGCAHARGDSGTTGANDGAYSYSYGYRFNGVNGQQYRTIMAYAPGATVAYYSNPDVVASEPGIAVPLGVPVGQAGETHNALTIDRDAFEVASYRTQAVPSYAGTLVNVSTRAYVGTGEQQLIGGFVVQGTQPKKMLLRAVGPGLTGYGVTGVLADPKLTLYQLGTGGAPNTQIGFNDNWGDQAGGVEAAAVALQVGAFALAPGSRDAAMVLSLNPGFYTANIEGVGGTTGITLVEAYDAEPNATRVINISTRGYADKSKLMIGGFVVTGDAGTTKRILIRVLGPSLADLGVGGVMDDPFLSLYDARSNLLLQNDDWDPPTTTLNGETITTRGAADLQSEKQIQATGYAPGNPREPAVLLDLQPGVYSVIVEPFELLTSNPPQVAAPGVAIIEVYEITGP